jgi:transposase-like protein
MPHNCTGAYGPKEMLRTGVRWDIAEPLRTRNLRAMRRKRPLCVDHSTMNRWVITYRPPLVATCHWYQGPVWICW